MKGFGAPDRRLSLRRKWRSKIVLEDEFGEGLIYLYSKDVSLGGVLLEDPPPIKLGACLFLSFALPGKKRPLRVTGQVVRFVEHPTPENWPMRQGAGVRFLDMDTKTFRQLADFIQASPQR